MRYLETNRPPREDFVAELTEKFRDGGHAALAPTLDLILAEGQQHAREWLECLDCTALVEQVLHGSGAKATRCPPCIAERVHMVNAAWHQAKNNKEK